MSTVEMTEVAGAWWSPVLGVLILIGFCVVVWAVIHAPLIHRRGRAYRRRMRAARHRRNALHHLTFRSPVR